MWIEGVQKCVGDWNDLRTAKIKLKEAKEEKEKVQRELVKTGEQLSAVKSKVDEKDAAVKEAERIRSGLAQLRDAGTRVDDKRRDMDSKKQALKAMAPESDGKTLREIEDLIKSKGQEKDHAVREMQELNKEMAIINKSIQNATTRASFAENTAKEKKEAFEKYGGLESRRAELREGIAECARIERDLREKEAPNRQATKA